MRKWLIYAIWSCEALGSLQIDIASPRHISLCPLLVMGDFNIDLLKASNDHVLDDFASLTNCFGWRNLINKPTRVTKETHTLIDHIYTNDSKHRMNSGICLWDITDHYHIFCIVCRSKSLHRVPKVTFRDMQQFSTENFLSEFQITLSSMPISEDVNSS